MNPLRPTILVAFLAACGGSTPPMVVAPSATGAPVAKGEGAPSVPVARPCSAVLGRWMFTTHMPHDPTARVFEIELLEGGKVISHDPKDTTPDNDEWSEDGTLVHFWFNNRYVEHAAECTTGNEMIGEALNREGHHWKWTAQRQQGAGVAR